MSTSVKTPAPPPATANAPAAVAITQSKTAPTNAKLATVPASSSSAITFADTYASCTLLQAHIAFLPEYNKLSSAPAAKQFLQNLQ